jgi:hypothetical protein
MANAWTRNPFILDTAESPALAASTPYFIKRVIWKNPTAQGDTFTLTAADTGTVIATGIAEVDGQSQVFLVEHAFDGMRLTQITSGTVYVYLG